MASVDVVNVRKSYGNVEVIHDVSISIADGEFVTLVGPSGCGKSTLLRMIAGLETIAAGKIRIGARVVNNLAPKDRDIAMVFQNYALYPHKTVAENMSFGLKLRHTPKGEIDARIRGRPKSCISGPTSRVIPGSFRAASGSGSQWDVRLCVIQRYFCSMSPSPTSTRSSGCRCEPRSRSCTSV